MTQDRVNYDEIAPTYDRRFVLHRSPLRASALRSLCQGQRANRILEVGCGTAHWLAQMDPGAHTLFGLDASAGMLRQAHRRGLSLNLVRGYARELPFESYTFDLVFCVNAIHHFDQPLRFIREASRILRAGGWLAVMGSNPHGRRQSWYAYEYFEGTYERDLVRFPRWASVSTSMADVGLEQITMTEIERISDVRRGREVLEDPFLRKNACSQLALLTDKAYEGGLQRIEAALEAAEATGEEVVFRTDLSVAMLSGRRP
jgi:ubiquinone/menaquinone biosynthesis C-methylase UbiE